MRYYLITRENSTQEDPFQLKSDRKSNIIFMQPLANEFKVNMVNKSLESLSVEFKLNNNDKNALDKNGITLIYQYPKYQLWIYDVKHEENSFLISLIRDQRIGQIIN